VAKRWTRYGKDRVYVETALGDKVGWLDLRSGVVTLERSDLAEAFEAAVAAYCKAGAPGSPDGRPVPRLDDSGLTQPLGQVAPIAAAGVDPFAERAWQDLATNRPGQAVRADAEALRADMQERSKVRTFFARVVDAKTEERAFRVGADGEEAVGPRLERLVKRGWHVLHSIPVGERGSDIDHLLIGPGGLYTINTKNHPGKKIWVGDHAILVNGRQTSYLRNSRFEAERVSKAMLRELGETLPVRPVLVLLTGTLIPQVTIKKMPSDVLVLDRMDVPGAFKHAPQRLSPEAVDRAYEVARRGTTWR